VTYALDVKRRALLACSLPLAAAGTLAGHAAGYALVGSSRRDAFAHGYLGYAPQFLALCVAVLVLALALRATGRLQGRPAAWPFALIPPVAFLAQELIERLVVGLPAHAVLEPAVYVGLAAQVPIALAGFLAAHTLLRAVDEATSGLVARPSFALRPTPIPAPAGAHAPVPARFAVRRRGRAPPR
jgi:hypothetical protein